MDQDQKQKNSYILPASIVIAGVIISISIFFIEPKNEGAPASESDPREVSAELEEPSLDKIKPVDETDHILGSPNAEVFIIEYSDIECPFCKQLHSTMHEIIKKHGKDGKVAWVYRHFPIVDLHPKALNEAIATECAAKLGGNSTFWNYLDRLFAKTPSNNNVDLSIILQTADELGLNKIEFESCVENNFGLEKIEDSIKNGLEGGVSGTPVLVFVGPESKFSLAGNQSIPVIETAIELALNGEK